MNTSAAVQESSAAPVSRKTVGQHMTLVAFSGDMDKLMATLSIATTAAASGIRVTIFFTFWGLSALRRKKRYSGKGLLERALNVLLPSRSNRTSLSRCNMFGIGPRFFRFLMKRKSVFDVDQLIEAAQLVGVHMIACNTSMDVMGIGADELIDGIEVAGATVCVRELMGSNATLFV